MIKNIMPGVWELKATGKSAKETFEPATCDPLDFETRLQKIREYGEAAVAEIE